MSDKRREGDANFVLTKEYRNYKYCIYLDAEYEWLVGQIYGLDVDYESDSITQLKGLIEKAIDNHLNPSPLTKLIELTEEAGLYDYY